jgi:hypothetical protein
MNSRPEQVEILQRNSRIEMRWGGVGRAQENGQVSLNVGTLQMGSQEHLPAEMREDGGMMAGRSGDNVEM